MAALRSAIRGDRVLAWRDWLTGYAAIWVLPIPLGLAMAFGSLLYRWPFEAFGRAIPADGPTSYMFGLGMVLVFVPSFSWIGLILSVPVAWAAMRLGLGGWLVFFLGGAASGAVAGALLGGMAPFVPMGIGALSALAFHRILRWLCPGAFDTTAQPDG